MTIDLQRHAIAASISRDLPRRDPLSTFRFQCHGQRDFARFIFDGVDTHGFTGNEGGKTTVGLAAFISMGQGRPELDGLKVPKLKLPATFWLIVKSRRGAVDSSQAKLLELLGTGPPPVIGWAQKALEYAEVVRFKPLGWRSDDPLTWSKFVIHAEEGQASLPGGRIDGALGDEPPDRENWNEVRSRAKSNCPLYLAIAETPVLRSQWWWLFNEDDGYRNCLGEPRNGRVSVNWALKDLVPHCHSERHFREIQERHAGDASFDARMTGWPVDDETVNPFSGRALALYREDCVKPLVVRVPLFESGADEHDRETLASWAEYQVWCKRQEWGRYAVVGDPSKGLEQASRSPSGLSLFEEVDPALVARYSGRLDPYSFGWLAGTMGRAYSDAEAHIETQGGYGLESIRALRRMRYPAIARAVRTNSVRGSQRPDFGFTTNESSKRAWVAAIQQMLADRLAGRPAMKIWSREVVDSLADATIDRETDKLVQDEHHRIEDIITLGYQLHRTLGSKRARERGREADPIGRALRSEFGRDPRPGRSRNPAAPEAFRT